VSSNIDYDLDDMALRPPRRWGRVLFAAAALTLVGGGAAFALGGGARSLGLTVPSMASLESAGNKTQASLTMDSIQTKPSEPAAAPVAPTPAPEPALAVAPAPVPSEAPAAAAPGLSDDMKQALLAQDKVHQTKHAARVKAHVASAGASVAHHGKAPAVGGGLKTGGSAYDPLNGKL
jgi:hypothetical protein